MRSAPAFTLTELLVVLTILALISALVSAGAPKMIERIETAQAARQLASDLDLAAMRARSDGAYGVIAASADEQSYSVHIGQEIVITRTLPRGIRYTSRPIQIDPAGRLEAGTLHLEGQHGEALFIVDPITGRAARNGADGSTGGQRHPRRRSRGLSQRRYRCPSRPGANTRPRRGARLGERALGGGPHDLDEWALSWRTWRFWLVTPLRHFLGGAESQAHARGMRGNSERAAWAWPKRHAGKRLGEPSQCLPAMTLVELMTALAILGLIASLVFTDLGPWLVRIRSDNEAASFWRENAPAQLILSELAADAIDPVERSVTVDRIQFRALAPRLSPTPVDVVLAITSQADEYQLALRVDQLGAESTLITNARPLRFRPVAEGAVSLEIERDLTWRPLATLPFAANAPISCDFDPISRTCR